jgi:hypothetical protein
VISHSKADQAGEQNNGDELHRDAAEQKKKQQGKEKEAEGGGMRRKRERERREQQPNQDNEKKIRQENFLQQDRIRKKNNKEGEAVSSQALILTANCNKSPIFNEKMKKGKKKGKQDENSVVLVISSGTTQH